MLVFLRVPLWARSLDPAQRRHVELHRGYRADSASGSTQGVWAQAIFGPRIGGLRFFSKPKTFPNGRAGLWGPRDPDDD